MPENELVLTELERQRATVLLCHPDQSVRLNLRRALEELKFKQISEVASHGKAIELLKERHFSHILFDSTPTNVDPSAFVLGVLRDTPETILLALSNLPEAERIFALLQCGTRGYLILPASKESLLESVIFASKGKPFDPQLLHAKERNMGLAGIVGSALDEVARAYRSITGRENSVAESQHDFQRTVRAAQMFAKGGKENLLEAFERYFLSRARGPATKLGRLRDKLKRQRGQSEPNQSDQDPEQ